MGTGSALYRVVLMAHIVTAVIGFGGLLANGIANAKAFHSPAAQARTLLAGSQDVAKTAYLAIYALLAFGIVLIAFSDSAFSFSAPWVSAAFVVWFAMVGISHGMVRPSIAGMLGRAEALEDNSLLDGDQEAGALAKRLAIGEGMVQVLVLVALYLMIWKPGN